MLESSQNVWISRSKTLDSSDTLILHVFTENQPHHTHETQTAAFLSRPAEFSSDLIKLRTELEEILTHREPDTAESSSDCSCTPADTHTYICCSITTVQLVHFMATYFHWKRSKHVYWGCWSWSSKLISVAEHRGDVKLTDKPILALHLSEDLPVQLFISFLDILKVAAY